jgi:hypothetical protein
MGSEIMLSGSIIKKKYDQNSKTSFRPYGNVFLFKVSG